MTARPKRAYTKLTDDQWNEIALQHDAGVSQTELSEAFGVSVRSLQNHLEAARYRTGKLSKQQRAAGVRTVAAVASSNVAIAALTASTTEERQHHARSRAWEMSCAIEASLAAAIADLAGENAKVKITKLDVAASVMGRIYAMRHQLLAMGKDDTGDQLPELPIREITAAEIDAVRHGQREENGGDDETPTLIETEYTTISSDIIDEG